MVRRHVRLKTTVLGKLGRTEITGELGRFLALVLDMSLKIFLVLVPFPTPPARDHAVYHVIT